MIMSMYLVFLCLFPIGIVLTLVAIKLGSDYSKKKEREENERKGDDFYG